MEPHGFDRMKNFSGAGGIHDRASSTFTIEQMIADTIDKDWLMGDT